MLSERAALYAGLRAPDRSALVTEIIRPAGRPFSILAQPQTRLLVSLDCLAVVKTAIDRSIAPCGHAVWLRPKLDHDLHFVGGEKAFIIAFDTSTSNELSDRNGVVELSLLRQELITAASRLPKASGPLPPRDTRLLRVLTDELIASPTVPALCLPILLDRRLQPMCEVLLTEPKNADPTSAWSMRIGVTMTTLNRRFRRQTGLTFIPWRQRARLLLGFEGLAAGLSVAAVSQACGYAGPSAFTAVFRRHFGRPPTTFVKATARSPKEGRSASPE